MLVNGKQGDLIGIRDRGLLYGDGVFRTMCASQGKLLDWSLHFKKLQHDCTALGITYPDSAKLSTELSSLLTQHPDGVFKLIVTRGEGSRGYQPDNHILPTYIWDIAPKPDYPVTWKKNGVKVRWCILRLSHQPLLAGIKHLNRLENVIASAETSDKGIAEGLLLDQDDNVIEGLRTNVFLVISGTLMTPDLSLCGVAGIQRDRVLTWAEQNGVEVHIRKIGREELLEADEVFLVNSIIGLWPVAKLENRHWSVFPLSLQIGQYLETTHED